MYYWFVKIKKDWVLLILCKLDIGYFILKSYFIHHLVPTKKINIFIVL